MNTERKNTNKSPSISNSDLTALKAESEHSTLKKTSAAKSTKGNSWRNTVSSGAVKARNESVKTSVSVSRLTMSAQFCFLVAYFIAFGNFPQSRSLRPLLPNDLFIGARHLSRHDPPRKVLGHPASTVVPHLLPPFGIFEDGAQGLCSRFHIASHHKSRLRLRDVRPDVHLIGNH